MANWVRLLAVQTQRPKFNLQHPWEDLVLTGMCLFGVEMLAIGITPDSVRDPILKEIKRQSRTLTSSSGHHQHTYRYTHTDIHS